MSRTYCGMSAGRTPACSSRSGGGQEEAVWMRTVSPEWMVSTGFAFDQYYPQTIVLGVAERVWSAAQARQEQARTVASNRRRGMAEMLAVESDEWSGPVTA